METVCVVEINIIQRNFQVFQIFFRKQLVIKYSHNSTAKIQFTWQVLAYMYEKDLYTLYIYMYTSICSIRIRKGNIEFSLCFQFGKSFAYIIRVSVRYFLLSFFWLSPLLSNTGYWRYVNSFRESIPIWRALISNAKMNMKKYELYIDGRLYRIGGRKLFVEQLFKLRQTHDGFWLGL